MATKISSIYTLITADDKPLKKGLASARNESIKGAKKIQNALNKINFKAVALGATAMAATMGYAAKKFIDLAVEQERVEKRLGAVLKSTGEAAGFNLDQMKAMASAMQAVTATGDETILSGMAILATFKQIRGEAFERTTMAALDLAEVMGQDLRSATVQLGKALNDPVANLGALSRAGIQFTKDQKAVIKSLWEAGKAAEAQSIILDEIESQFGGTAKAARDTFGGALKSLQNTLGDVGETIGFALMPPVKEIINKLSNWIAKNEVFLNQDMPGYIGMIAENLGTVVMQLGKIAKYAGLRSIMDTYLKGIELSTKGLIDYNTFVTASFFKRQKMVDEAIKQTEELGRVTKKITKETPGYSDYIKKKVPGDKIIPGKDSTASEITLKSNKKVVPVLTDMWATYYDEQTQMAAEASAEKAEVLNSMYPESNKKTVMVLTDMWATYNNEQVQAAAAMSAEKAETLKLWEEENKSTFFLLEDLSVRTAESMQQNFSDLFFDAMTGEFKSLNDYATAVLRSIQRAIADMAGQSLTQGLFGKDFKGGGWVSNLFSSGSVQTGKQTFQGDWAGINADIGMNNGGYIGEPVRGFGMSGKSYEFHPNEIVTPVGKSGGGVQIDVSVVNNLGQEAEVSQSSNWLSPDKMVADIILNKKMTSRGFRQGLRS